jgi:hypothetical protein
MGSHLANFYTESLLHRKSGKFSYGMRNLIGNELFK